MRSEAFASQHTRAVVIANGELPDAPAAAARLRPDDLVIAADGGARHCPALGVRPHVIIGDIDSLAPEERAAWQTAGVPFETSPAKKDETDLELALLFAAAQGVGRIVVLAALGGRLDMALANVLLLMHPGLAGVPIEVWHGAQTTWLIRPPGGDIHGQPGDTLSLIPLGGDATGITTHGLAYPLRGETLAAGPARGVSNVLTEPPARVAFTGGALLATLTPGRA